MNHTLPRFLIIGLLAGVTSTAMAQTDLSYLFTSRPKWWFSAGINIRSGGPSVKFSHLGSLPRGLTNLSTGASDFDDGSVGLDGPRTDQVDISQTSKIRYNASTVDAATRYQVLNSDGTVAADEWVYKTGLTRLWSVDNASQVNGDEVAFHLISARETGLRSGGGEGGTGNESGKSSGGFDIQLARDIGLIGKRASWGIAFSIGMNDISGKTSQAITADEVITTATYKLNEPIPSTPGDTSSTGTYYSAPSPGSFSQGAGGVEDTARLSASPIDPVTKQPIDFSKGQSLPYTVVQNAATVTGQWKIKGAYYLMRLGPQFRYYANRRFSFSGTAGIAGAYAGSDFTVDETLTAPVISTLTSQPNFVGTSHKREFMVGGYAEANAEFWITFRTGFYGGVVYEALGKYKHEFVDPFTTKSLGVANVNVGSGLSFRLGLITRF